MATNNRLGFPESPASDICRSQRNNSDSAISSYPSDYAYQNEPFETSRRDGDAGPESQNNEMLSINSEDSGTTNASFISLVTTSPLHLTVTSPHDRLFVQNVTAESEPLPDKNDLLDTRDAEQESQHDEFLQVWDIPSAGLLCSQNLDDLAEMPDDNDIFDTRGQEIDAELELPHDEFLQVSNISTEELLPLQHLEEQVDDGYLPNDIQEPRLYVNEALIDELDHDQDYPVENDQNIVNPAEDIGFADPQYYPMVDYSYEGDIDTRLEHHLPVYLPTVDIRGLRQLLYCKTCLRGKTASMNWPCLCFCNCLDCMPHMFKCAICRADIHDAFPVQPWPS